MALTMALTSPVSILDEIVRYEFVGVEYFQKYGERLLGRVVSVFGCLELAPGANPVERTAGTIRSSCETAAGAGVPAVFKSMTASAAISFYDAKQPVSYWKGTVERRGASIVLAQVEP